ncbi:Histidine kinase [compost metagenome]
MFKSGSSDFTFYSPAFVYQLLVIILGLSFWIYRLSRKIRILKQEKQSVASKFEELNNQKHVLELETIKHKLNPHLFKNILNSIQSHAYSTYKSLDRLSGVLDYILYESDQQFVSISQEFSFARNLVDINRLKMSPLFDIRADIIFDEQDDMVNEPLIAPLICAPIIENAFKHADLQSEDAFINIRLEYRSGMLSLKVANKVSDKPLLKKEKSGVGNKSLEKRLELIYGDVHTLTVDRKDQVYQVLLKIDLHGYKNKMHHS